MATKRKSKTLKLKDSVDQQRDDVEFIVDDEVVAFRLKLPEELSLEDLDEYNRLRRQLEQSESLADDNERLEMVLRVLRRLIHVLFYDPVPDPVSRQCQPGTPIRDRRFFRRTVDVVNLDEGDSDGRETQTAGTPLDEVDFAPIIARLQRFYHTASPLVWKRNTSAAPANPPGTDGFYSGGRVHAIRRVYGGWIGQLKTVPKPPHNPTLAPDRPRWFLSASRPAPLSISSKVSLRRSVLSSSRPRSSPRIDHSRRQPRYRHAPSSQ